MKYKFILIGILLTTVFSCKKFLVVNPETSIPQSNFYKTQGDFEQAVVGIYAPLQPLYNQAYQLTEFRSDNTYFVYNTANRGGKATEDLATFTVETNNLILQNNWQNNYLIISRANQVLKTIDGVDFDQTEKDNLKGQALFLRALAYFDLVKNFGGVPIFLDPPTSYSTTFKQRSSADDVYTQIIADAKASSTLLPKWSPQSIVGRATSGSAFTLLADVEITLKNWTEAESALRSVLSMGYGLLPQYADIFKPSNKGNMEMIFEVNYIESTAQPLYSTFPYAFLPVLSDASVLTGVGPSTSAGNGYNIPTPDLIAAYEDTVADKRYAASIGRYTGSSPLPGVTYNNLPYIKKFLQPHAIAGQTNENWPVYRYAEVLLMLAEALNEQGKSSEALPYLNLVRNRAGLSSVTNTDQSALRDIILHERQIELAFENKRWHDLVRTGQAVSVMNAFGARVKANPQNYYYAAGIAPVSNAFNVTNDFLIYPIPVTEIIINNKLVQNPGY